MDSPGAYIIKLITAVNCGFRNKLECLSLASLSAYSSVKGQTLRLITEIVNYDRNKFYDTGPRLENFAMDNRSSLFWLIRQ